MKRIMSILLVALMLMSCLVCTLGVFAEEANYTCTCADCKKTPDCRCCIYCNYTAKRMSCVATHGGANGEAVYCCSRCTGFLGCTCGDNVELCDCEACKLENQNGQDPYSGNTQIVDSDTQKTIIEIFQNVLSKISGVFDKLFDAIFEFLRIGDFNQNNG